MFFIIGNNLCMVQNLCENVKLNEKKVPPYKNYEERNLIKDRFLLCWRIKANPLLLVPYFYSVTQLVNLSI